MKTISFFFFLLMFTSCSSQIIFKNNITIKYEAITRGSSIELATNLDSLQYKDYQATKKIKLSKKEIKSIKKELEKLELSALKNLNPPSTKSYTDAALQATLSIQVDKKTYKTKTFDHGNPPKEIKYLIELLFKELDLE